MSETLKEQMIQALTRLKKMNWSALYTHMDLPSLGLMKSIEHNSPDSDDNVYMVDLQEQLYVSKAAISQLAGHLEQKGLLLRETNKNNRRKVTITLTEPGRAVLARAWNEFDVILDEFIKQLGDADARETVRLFNRFADITESLSKERDN
ncbi:MAG: MarR family transcriptional regulator [Clostridiales bacterium]|jgi:DNA-binding MarR family transcriptional regulator|nr:MarR family transcriptional regulator [Clostridiales bacterium]